MPFISLQSTNFPDRFIRHQNFLGELSQIQSDLDRQDATFEIPEGAGVGSMVMLRSLNFPLHVLRHQNFRIRLDEFNPPLTPPPGSGLASRPETPEEELLRKDATFVLRPGIADPNAVSFQSLNFPDRFIRHRDFHLFVEAIDMNSDVARHDATFIKTEPKAAPPPPPIIH
jgi:Alpha-L-arabinofuranosidase B (ABFB) domain